MQTFLVETLKGRALDAMKILIVEDNKADLELLKFLLAERFKAEAKFREAQDLKSAMAYLSKGDIDCIILDLQLPDSAGKETFQKIASRYPQIPIIVMTHNKSRDLALEMIKNGAADYIIKNFTDEEELFRRVLFAVEKHRHTITIPPDGAASVHRLEKARADMLSASESGEHHLVQDSTVKATTAVADLSQRMFAEVQRLNISFVQHSTRAEHLMATVDKLKAELLDGYPNEISLKSAVMLIDKRVSDLEEEITTERTTQLEIKKAEIQVNTHQISNRTKIVVAIIGLISLVLGAAATAYVNAMYPSPKTPTEKTR